MDHSTALKTISLGDDEMRVVFGIEDLCRHTMIFGSSGSGKTTRAYNPMLLEMLGKLQAGAFIIAAKVEAVGEAVEIARRAGRESLVIEPGSPVGLDLLSGSPDVDAMYFRDTFGRVGEEAKQWVDAAVARMKNALRMLKAAGSQYYTFEHLTGYCFDEKFAAMVRIQASERLRALSHDSDEAWTIREAMSYEDTRYLQFTPESRRAVQFAVSMLLEPLRDVAISRTFARKHNLVQIEQVFEGKVIILHVPRTKYERAAQAIYTIAKRRFFTAMENRRADATLDQSRPDRVRDRRIPALHLGIRHPIARHHPVRGLHGARNDARCLLALLRAPEVPRRRGVAEFQPKKSSSRPTTTTRSTCSSGPQNTTSTRSTRASSSR